MWLFSREVQCEVLGFCVSWGNRASGATCRVTGFSFPPLSGKSGSSCSLMGWGLAGRKDSLAVRDSGECWVSMLCREGSLLAPADLQGLEPVVYLGVWWLAPGTVHQVESTHGASRLGRLELSSAHKAVEVLGSICIEEWASRSHRAAASLEHSLCSQSSGLISCIGFRGLRYVVQLLGEQSLLARPSVTHGTKRAMGPAYTGALVSLTFQGEGSRSCIGRSLELRVPVCARWDLLLNNGAWSSQRLQGWGIKSVELQVILPILPLVSCLSVSLFKDSGRVLFLADYAFWGPLIFLLGGWLLLGYRNVNNPPSCSLPPFCFF
jgi:hypothetical protein